MIIVCNATCLIGLSKIGQLNVLKEIYRKIYICVYTEVVVQGKGRPGSKEVEQSDWIKVKSVKDQLAVQFLQVELSKGEAETITLAKELKADFVILDERKAADIALMSNLRVMGTLGVLRKAKEEGKIDNLIDLVDKLRKAKFWISDKLYKEILKEYR